MSLSILNFPVIHIKHGQDLRFILKEKQLVGHSMTTQTFSMNAKSDRKSGHIVALWQVYLIMY